MTTQAHNDRLAPLNPDVLRPRVAEVGIFLCAYELLIESIKGLPKLVLWPESFFGGAESQLRSDQYENEILSRDPKGRSIEIGSLNWLVECAILNDTDRRSFWEIRKMRNDLAHELHKALLYDGLPSDLPDRLTEIVLLENKLATWQFVNFDFDPEEYPSLAPEEASVVSGRVTGIQMLANMLLGPEQESRRQFQELARSTSVPITAQMVTKILEEIESGYAQRWVPIHDLSAAYYRTYDVEDQTGTTPEKWARTFESILGLLVGAVGNTGLELSKVDDQVRYRRTRASRAGT